MIDLSTPFSCAAANFLENIGGVGFKIGSGKMNSTPLLTHIAAFNKPMIISTSMSLKSVEEKVPLALIHTTNNNACEGAIASTWSSGILQILRIVRGQMLSVLWPQEAADLV
ncbi:N-acetylneuraminic acid synthetase [Helicobacter heilmannii]|nr:N-acetylneuraminate synthase family protein [Helicobacter heilmannii]CRF47245.1 N-acetylneuraminic acid synthetase [Helicobacter heilmannii]